MTALLILTLLSQWGWWGPGINADFLQGKDTTALWNAKTLQGKDTTAFARLAAANVFTGTIQLVNAANGDTINLRSGDISIRHAGARKAYLDSVGRFYSASCSTGTVTGASASFSGTDSALRQKGDTGKFTGQLIAGNGTLKPSLVLDCGGPAITGNPNVLIFRAVDYPYMQFVNNVSGGAGSDGFFVGVEDGLGVHLWNKETWPFIFGTNNVERMRILPGGGVVIDTSAARGTEKLFVKGNARVSDTLFANNFAGQLAPYGTADSLVTRGGVDLIVHGPAKVDSAFTLTGIKVDSFRVAADTSTFTVWIGPHSFTIPED